MGMPTEDARYFAGLKFDSAFYYDENGNKFEVTLTREEVQSMNIDAILFGVVCILIVVAIVLYYKHENQKVTYDDI